MLSKTSAAGRVSVPAPNSVSSNPPVKPLLVSRKAAAAMLGGVNVATIRRLEKEGLLKPKRLSPRSPTGQVFFAYEDVVAVAQGGSDAQV